MLSNDTINYLKDSITIGQDSLHHHVDSVKSVLVPLADTVKTQLTGFVGMQHPSLPSSKDWVFVVLLMMFLWLIIALGKTQGWAGETIGNFFKIKERKSIFSKNPISRNLIRFYFMPFSLLSYSMVVYLFFYQKDADFSLMTFINILGAISIFYVLKTLFMNILGYIFIDRNIAKLAKNNYFDVLIILSIVFFPLVVFRIYASLQIDEFFNEIVLILLILSEISIIIKLFQIFFRKFLASFYIMLYLCTLEILPLLILIGVFQKLI